MGELYTLNGNAVHPQRPPNPKAPGTVNRNIAVERDGMNGWLYLTGVRKCLAARQLARLRAQSPNLKRQDDNDAEHH